MALITLVAMLAFTGSAYSNGKSQDSGRLRSVLSIGGTPSCVALLTEDPAIQPVETEPYQCHWWMAYKTAISITVEDTYIPTCDVEDDSFAPKQCDSKECWCAEKNGAKVEGKRKPRDQMIDCNRTEETEEPSPTLCEIKRAESLNASSLFVPNCTAEGDFEHEQCITFSDEDKFCLCMTPDGKIFPDTQYHHGTEEEIPDCRAHRDTLKKFQCKKIGHFEHPFDCRRYMHCGIFLKTYSCVCPSGLFYNVEKKVCDWPENVPCNGTMSSSSS